MKDSKFQNYVAQNLSNEIRLADTKAAWTFSVLGVCSAVLTNKVIKMPAENLWQRNTFIALVMGVVLIVLAIKHTIAVVYPRMRRGQKEGLIYFKDILENKKEEYIKKSINLSEEQVIRKFAELSYDLSLVVSRKFYHLRIAMIYAICSLGATVFIISFF